MAIYYPTISEIDDTISNAQPSDIIYLPNETINSSISISNPCIVKGQENTIIDCEGNESFCLKATGDDIEISDLKIQNAKSTGFNGLELYEFTGNASNIEVSQCDNGLLIQNSHDCEINEIKVYDSIIGFSINDSHHINFIVEAFECNFGYNIEGSSSIMGDIFAHQDFGLNVTSNNISGISRVSDTVMLNSNPISIGDIVSQINNELSNTSTYIEAYQDNNKIGLRLLTGLPNDTTFLIEDNTTFGWTAGTYDTEHLGVETIDIGTIDWSTTPETFIITIDVQKEYSIEVNGKEYFFTCSNNSTYLSLIANLNNAETTSNELLKTTHHVNFVNNDIRITMLTDDPLTVSAGSEDFFLYLNGFSSLPAVESSVVESERDDRSHNLIFTTSQAYNNTVGIKLSNTNQITFDNCLVYSNNDIGIWQLAESYENTFNGEIYNNTNYGIKNSDKDHVFVSRQTWWGSQTGPSMMGKGDGDKVSSGVEFDDWRRTGNEPELSYPYTRNWIWRMLGYPLVRVELTEEQVNDSIGMAIERYEEYRIPEQTYYYLGVTAGQSVIELPLHINKKEVIEVVYSPHADLFSQLTGAGEAFYLTYYLQNTGGTFLSDFYIAMAYKETLEMTLGISPTYEFFTSKNSNGEWRDYIRISPKPSVSLQIGILYNRPMTEEEVDSATWIRKYALTWAKEQLGRIRSKYTSIPGPTGEMQMDGQQLISEAQQERQALEESVISKGPPLTFDVG